MTLQILLLFGTLSLLAVGGMSALLPELHRQVVERRGWLDDAGFAAAFALAQAAPGPNVLAASLIGWKVDGWAGLAAATVGIVAPAGCLAWAVGGVLLRRRDARWLRALRGGLVPVAVGLMGASGLVLAGAVAWPDAAGGGPRWGLVAVAAVAAGVVWRAPWSPLWVLAGGALAGLAVGL